MTKEEFITAFDFILSMKCRYNYDVSDLIDEYLKDVAKKCQASFVDVCNCYYDLDWCSVDGTTRAEVYNRYMAMLNIA